MPAFKMPANFFEVCLERLEAVDAEEYRRNKSETCRGVFYLVVQEMGGSLLDADRQWKKHKARF